MCENKLKIGVLQGGGSVSVKFSRRRRHSPPVIFARIVRPMNALPLSCWQFSHRETLYQTFFKQSAILLGKRRFAFL